MSSRGRVLVPAIRGSDLGILCTTRCVAVGVGARGAYTRGHSETRHGDVCLPQPAPRPECRFRGALACKAPSAPTPSATYRVGLCRGSLALLDSHRITYSWAH